MDNPSLLQQLTRTDRFARGAPVRLSLSPDGRAVLFLRARSGEDPAACLWELDVESGRERLLADPVRLCGDRQRGGIGAYATDRAAGLVAFALDGELWALRPGRGRPLRLPTHGPVSDPRPDPTGRRIAYVSQGTLRVIDADGTADRALAEPDGPDVEFGAAAHTASTSIEGPRGHWWSPDGSRLLVARTDSAAVRPWPEAGVEGAGGPRRLAAVGTPNPDVSLSVIGLNGLAEQVCWDREAFEYVVGAGWDPHGPHVVVQSRDQRTVRFLAIDPADGSTTVLCTQRDPRWVQLVPGLPARAACGALLAHADLGGTRHLTVDGAPVTPPGLNLRAVLGIEGDDVLLTASGEPTETHLWSWRPGEGLRQLSTDPAVHFGVRCGGTLVRVTRGADRPGGRVEVLRDGKPAGTVASYVERPLLDPHMTHLVLGPRALRARLHLPSWHRPGGGRLPVLVDPYGGAGAQRVTAEVEWKVLVSQWFAEQGFAVLVADGRGTPGRGPDWEREVYGDLFGPAVDDQVTALREAARHHPDLDLGRVGIRGWSFGGSLALAAVLNRPDVFHAAVAGACVTDQLLYDAHWRERFLGHPDRYPRRYEANSLVLQAPKLDRPLLLIHGLADSNVPPANSVRMSEALHAAGRPHELLLLPDVGHQPAVGAITEELLDRQARFLRRHLGQEDRTAQ